MPSRRGLAWPVLQTIQKLIDNHSHLQLNGCQNCHWHTPMYVCICNAVTEKMIRAAAAQGAATLEDLNRMTGCAGCCGSCADLAEEVLNGARRELPAGLRVLAQAA